MNRNESDKAAGNFAILLRYREKNAYINIYTHALQGLLIAEGREASSRRKAVASSSKKYSSEFKAKVALEAIKGLRQSRVSTYDEGLFLCFFERRCEKKVRSERRCRDPCRNLIRLTL